MHKILLSFVLCVMALSAKSQVKIDASSFYGEYKGTMKTIVKTSSSSTSTSRAVVVTLAKGTKGNEVKLTLSGYQIGKYELKDFDFPEMLLVQENGKWKLIQESNGEVSVESKKEQGNTTFDLWVSFSDQELKNDGSLSFLGDFIYGKTYMDIMFTGKRDVSTGISRVEDRAESKEDKIFDLQGRRISIPRKGIYIINGKKVLVK